MIYPTEQEAWLMVREMTPHELVQALKRWGYTETNRAKEVLRRVKENKE